MWLREQPELETVLLLIALDLTLMNQPVTQRIPLNFWPSQC